ncbi:MAG TPA: deoxyribodipyrimidine photo-lyase, partial [Anaerolineae bacterium]
MTRVIWWLRRDLRLTDNLTLHQALRDGATVIPTFVLDTRLLESKQLAPARRQFLFDSLGDLDAQLRSRGSRLILRRGDPAKVLVDLARESAADAVYFHRDWTPYARRRDERATRLLQAIGIRVRTCDDLYLAAPEQVVKNDGTPYAVYTPYRNRFEQVVALPPRYATRGELNTPPDIESLDLRASAGAHNPQFARGGETEGLKMARAFMRRADGLVRYGLLRDDLACEATSRLSPHLHFGTVSVRELARRARTLGATSPLSPKPRNPGPAVDANGAGAWLGELVWREFYAQVLWHFPHAARQAFRRE